jgi:hypothetical protein
MAMVGHETEEVYRRYAIVDEAMMPRSRDQNEPRCKKVRRSIGGTPQATDGEKTLSG